MLIEDVNGVFYPTGRILRFQKIDDRYRVDFTEGESTWVLRWVMERFMSRPVQTFAASPGMAILQPEPMDDAPPYTTPIIAWAVGNEGHIYPITTDGVNDGLEDHQYIQHPDGRITRAEDGEWADLQALLTSLEADRKLARQLQAAG